MERIIYSDIMDEGKSEIPVARLDPSAERARPLTDAERARLAGQVGGPVMKVNRPEPHGLRNKLLKLAGGALALFAVHEAAPKATPTIQEAVTSGRQTVSDTLERVGARVSSSINFPEISTQEGQKTPSDIARTNKVRAEVDRIPPTDSQSTKVEVTESDLREAPPAPTLDYWDRPAVVPPPGSTPSTVDQRAKQYIQTQTAKPK